MNLFQRMSKEDNKDILGKINQADQANDPPELDKIGKIIQKAEDELKPYLEDYLISIKKNIEEKDIYEIIHEKDIVNSYMDDIDMEDSYALKVNLRSTKIDKNLKIDIKNFFSDALKSAISSLKTAKALKKAENYAEALDHIIKANKAIGCLEAAKKLDLFKQLLTANIEKKVSAARASHASLPDVKKIVYRIAQKHANFWKSKQGLFDAIAFECHAEIKSKLGAEAINWKEVNFATTFNNHTRADKEFGKSIDLLLQKK